MVVSSFDTVSHLDLYHSKHDEKKLSTLFFRRRAAESCLWLFKILTVSLSSTEGAISLSIVWLEGYVLCDVFLVRWAFLVDFFLVLNLLKVGLSITDMCIAQMLLSHHLTRG